MIIGPDQTQRVLNLGRSEPWVFVLASASESISLLVCPTSYAHLYYPIAEKKKLAELLRPEEVRISPFSILIGHEYLRNRECGWRASHYLRYHTYLIPASCELNDAAVLAYGASFLVRYNAAA